MSFTRRPHKLCLVLLTALFIVQGMSSRSVGQTPSMRGFADIHNHQFANLAFGGEFLTGSAYGSPEEALGSDGKHSYRHTADWLGAWTAGSSFFPYNYSNGGFPAFDGWPAFFEVSHQHVYQDWLLRAVQGGLRLMVMMAIDSPLLCRAQTRWTDGRNCDDEMYTINLQIKAAKDMQAFIDTQSGGPGQGWYRIVTTPAEARAVIKQGKLAVVLGVETAHLFNCKAEPCNWSGPLDALWNAHIRHYFPIHQDENAFGGPSYFEQHIQKQVNWAGSWLNPEHWFTEPYRLYTHPCSQYEIGRCDDHGLTDTGKAFVTELMNRGALIDVDHMSDRSIADTLDLAERNSSPVVAGHSSFNEIKHKEQDHEGQLTPSELQRIRGVGGMLGLISSLISNDGDRTQVSTYNRPGRLTIQHVCGRSTETFAQGYLYAIDHVPDMPLAIGTDSNGALREVGPRFGSYRCDAGIDKNKPFFEGRLNYPFLARGSEQVLSRMTSGRRTFDFNNDGLANEGLLPDMFADLEVLGIAPQDLEPLYNSAEGYVRMWERAERTRNPLTTDDQGSIYYVGSDQAVHQMWWGGTKWLDANLMAASQSGIQVARKTGPTSDTASNVYYIASDMSIHQMYWAGGTRWNDTNLMASSQSGLKVASGSKIATSAGGNVFYVASDGTMHQMLHNATKWIDINLMESSQSGMHLTPGTDFAVDDGPNIFYVATDRTIHQMLWGGTKWLDFALMQSAGSNSTVFEGAGLTADDHGSVFYTTADQRLHQMTWGGTKWLDLDLTESAETTTKVSIGTGPVASNGSVFYVGTDQAVHQMSWNGIRWVDANLMTASSSDEQVSAGSRPIVDKNERIFYLGTDQAVHQLIWNGSNWADINLMDSSQSGSVVAELYPLLSSAGNM